LNFSVTFRDKIEASRRRSY